MAVNHSALPLDTATTIATAGTNAGVRVSCPPRTRMIELSGAAAMRLSYLVADGTTLDTTNSVALEANVRHQIMPSGRSVGGRNTSTTPGGPAFVISTVAAGAGAVSVVYRG